MILNEYPDYAQFLVQQNKSKNRKFELGVTEENRSGFAYSKYDLSGIYISKWLHGLSYDMVQTMGKICVDFGLNSNLKLGERNSSGCNITRNVTHILSYHFCDTHDNTIYNQANR